MCLSCYRWLERNQSLDHHWNNCYRVANLLRRFCPYFLDILDFAARSELLGDAIEYIALLLGRFQLFLPFFGLLILFHSIRPTSHISSYSILDGPVCTHDFAVLSTMRHVLSLRHSCLLAKHTIDLGIEVLV